MSEDTREGWPYDDAWPYDPDRTLADRLDQTLFDWEAGFERFWGLDATECPAWYETETEWLIACALNQIAPKVLASARALLLDPNVAKVGQVLWTNRGPKGAVRRLAEKSVVVRHRIEAELATEFNRRLADAADRAVRLLRLLLRSRPSTFAAEYLDRATTLYVWGFEAECVVMCRSVLEAALESRIENDAVASALKRPPGRGADYTVWERIDAALVLGLLTPAHKRLAHEIRRTANELVHTRPAPDPERDAWWTVSSLAEILSVLFPARDAE